MNGLYESATYGHIFLVTIKLPRLSNANDSIW